MKKLKTAFVILLMPLLYYLFVTGFTENGLRNKAFNPPAPDNGKNFENVIFNLDSSTVSGASFDPSLWIPSQISRYKGELNFTGIQSYEFGSGNFGLFEDSLTTQQTQNIAGLSSIVTSHDLDFYFHRPNISNLCYGQRVVFLVTQPPGNNTVNDGYCFGSTGGEYIPDQGRNVLHASDIEEYPNGYWLAKNIYENKAFANFDDFGHGATGPWYIKPMMRIPVNTPDNMDVVRIDVINYNNQQIKSITIKAYNFKDNGVYNGNYTDKYFNLQPGQELTVIGGDGTVHTPPVELNEGVPRWSKAPVGYYRPWHTNCRVDFKIYWLGQVECWFELMTVDEEYANRLFDPDLQVNFDGYIQDEVTKTGQDGFTYYVDEVTTSNVPCIKYVMDKMHEYNSNAKLLCATNYCWDVKGTVQEELLSKHFLQTIQPPTVELNMVDVFEIFPGNLPEGVFQDHDIRIPGSWFGSRDNYTRYVQNYVFGDRNSRTHSDQWDYTNWYIPPPSGSDVYAIEHAKQQIDLYSPNTKLMVQGQMHSWMHVDHNTGQFDGMTREPFNEEIAAQAGVFLAHGAGSMCWFIYQSMVWAPSPWPMNLHYSLVNPEDLDSSVSFGLTAVNSGSGERTVNCYNQNKWAFVSQLNGKIMAWKPVLDNTTWLAGYSVHSERANHEYIGGILSILPGVSGYNPCQTDGFQNLYMDCPDETYWEMGFYNDPANANNKYLLMVNRRSIPHTSIYSGDNRVLRIKFNGNNLPGTLNSWKLSEVNSIAEPVYFLRNYTGYLSLGNENDVNSMGYFEPGECKLYKIEPVMKGGGTLVADETIDGNLTVEDTVWTNGYNITVENNSNISFTDSSCFVIQGGSFTMGNSLYSGVPNITCGAATGNTWNGFVFDSCEVRIYNSTFSGFGSDTSYALNMIDCPLIDIRNNAFSNSQNSTLGAINVTFYDIDSINNVYIENNTFELTNSVVPAVNILSYAGITTPLIIENNTFSSNTDNSTAILLSGITGGAVKSNTLTNFHIGLNLLSSSIDVSENTISSTLENAIGILAVSGSEIKMNPSGELQLGGMNNISCTETGSINIKVDNSYFNMDFGENIFNIAEINYSYHMNGWFNAFLPVTTDARENCFKVNSQPQAPPIENLTWGEGGSDINFVFSPYLTGCIPEGCQTYYIVDLGGGLYDTICVGGGFGMLEDNGYGLTTGGISSNASTESMYSTKSIILNPKQAYDSLCIYMRLRNYAQAKNKCYELINNYPDSIQSVNAINKLFLATTATDASQNGTGQLKIYFETLILNHSGNVPLVKRCNYFVQKCKVRMHEYSSALTGFQQIITQNPASYEGLVARWDYMATSLLMHGGGTGGISRDFGLEIAPAFRDLKEEAYKAYEFDEFDEFDESDKFEESDELLGDDNPFTREEKKTIRNAVNNVLNVSRENNDKRIEIITREADNGNNNAKRELEHINKMKEVVKTQKPKNVIEHIKIINSDIQKIFGGKSSNNKPPQNNIPVVYRLAQNYPNPFNPITTIKYEIPKDSKVKLVVYDLLGREIKTLVNNEIKSAGYYKIEFNMQNYASGVYFYRIEADDVKGNKFTDAKKMVLVK